MEAMFSDDHKSTFGQRDLAWSRSNETWRLKETIKFPPSFMIWGCRAGKGPGQMVIISSTVISDTYSINRTKGLVMKRFFRIIMDLATEQRAFKFLLFRKCWSDSHSKCTVESTALYNAKLIFQPLGGEKTLGGEKFHLWSAFLKAWRGLFLSL